MKTKDLIRAIPLLALTTLLGCNATESVTDEPPDYARLVEAKGTVTLNGKPVPGVVVTFLPPKWSASNGETAADGSYSLQTVQKPGAMPGTYKVAISYLVSTDGVPQGLAPRSAMNPPPSLSTAKEKIPPEYSDLGRTTLKATVTPGGGPYNFDVKANLEPPADAPKEKTKEKAADKEAPKGAP